MSAERRVYIFTFDVVDDKRRRKLSKHLEKHGVRVQKSVFEVTATLADMQQIAKSSTEKKHFSSETDSLRVYPLCGYCHGGALVRGVTTPPLDPDEPIVV